MGVDTIKRFDRIVAIMIQLQSKRVVRAQELADRFQVSLRTIYRDIRTLESCGVPIVGEAGRGYSVMEGYRLPPVMFTREEAGSFLAAEKLMQKFTDRSLGAHYESAMFKIKSVLRGKEKDWITALENQVVIEPTQKLFNENSPDALEILFESIVEKKQVFLRYGSLREEKPTERTIEPVAIFNENHFWYVLGYCHFRKDYQNFRTDRMLRVQRTKKLFSLEHGTIEEYRNKTAPIKKTKVRILVDKTIARYIKSGRERYGFVSEQLKGDQIEMTFMSSDIENEFPRWYIMFGDYAKILEPQRLKKRVLDLITKTESKLFES
ncbi:YafY family transcriptional regulator [Flavobacteriaceae bacterium TP-CH-4]|uniref:YafY family transcriptional regulator n=1 Tax=Pelagihabitans pacificus TaxID=2696054 RepID=A0A967AVM4_9FLAO|nr:YafY family protein [Pelagihabitans pacificus]NHF59908.1 YafY family transcriptional regulator [Pelagihabitans pacificus]